MIVLNKFTTLDLVEYHAPQSLPTALVEANEVDKKCMVTMKILSAHVHRECVWFWLIV